NVRARWHVPTAERLIRVNQYGHRISHFSRHAENGFRGQAGGARSFLQKLPHRSENLPTMVQEFADSLSTPARLNAFPVFLRVEGRIAVIVGGGDEALAKARLMAQSSAKIRIVSADPEPALAAWAADE